MSSRFGAKKSGKKAAKKPAKKPAAKVSAREAAAIKLVKETVKTLRAADDVLNAAVEEYLEAHGKRPGDKCNTCGHLRSKHTGVKHIFMLNTEKALGFQIGRF